VKYLRVWLEARPIGYVLAVSGKDTVCEVSPVSWTV